jgi:glycerophosphoryl diester phosphodiesterase
MGDIHGETAQMRRLAYALPILLAACADGAPSAAPSAARSGAASGAAPAPQRYAVDPAGDLNAFFECHEAAGATLVSAHRGGPRPGFPENALETLEETLARAPALAEIDIAQSADGVLFLMHDDDLSRTTTGEGLAAEATWATLQTLRLKDNDGRATDYRIPRLADILQWAEGKTVLQLDFKRSARYEDVAQAVAAANAERRVILIAYTMAQAQKLHRLTPDAMISLSLEAERDLDQAIAAGVPADRLLGFTGIEAPAPRLNALLNARDVEVIFGTLGRDGLDDEAERSGDDAVYASLAGIGVDIIATDRPLEAHAALEAAGRAPKAGACGVARR